jgi:UDP-glucose 6-dehydrogenase
LRIDLLEGQSNSIARMLAKAMQERNEEAIKQYSEKLAQSKGKVEELLCVLGVKTGQNALDVRAQVPGRGEITVRDILELLKEGKVKMDGLPLDVQALVRKGALEAKNAMRHTT